MNTVRLVLEIGSKRRELTLSADRARRMGIRAPRVERVTSAYLLDALLAPAAHDGACNVCGTTHREIVLTRRAGCEQCYHAYQATIERLTRRPADAGHFVGRIPVRLARFRRLFVDREALIERLRVAVSAEDYEAAATLRDQITDLVHGEDAES